MTAPIKPYTEMTLEELEEEKRKLLKLSGGGGSNLSPIPASATPVNSSPAEPPRKYTPEWYSSLSDEELLAEKARLEAQKGGMKGVADALTAAPGVIKAIGTQLITDPLGSLESMAMGLKDIATPSGAVGLVKGLWDETIGAVANVSDVAGDAFLDKILGDGVRPDWMGKDVPNLTDQERYHKMRQATTAAMGFLTGAVAARQVGKKVLGEALTELKLKPNWTADDFIETMALKSPDEMASAMRKVQVGLKNGIKRGATEGLAGGVGAMLFDPMIAESDDPLRDAMMYGVLGTVLGVGFEGISGRNKMGRDFQAALVGSIRETQPKILTPENSVKLTQALINEGDLIGATIENMNPYAVLTGEMDEGITLEGMKQRHKNNLAVWTNPETGKQHYMLMGNGYLELAKIRKKPMLIDTQTGQTMIVYHGSPIDINAPLEPSAVLGGTGFYTTRSLPMSEEFSMKGGEDRTRIVPKSEAPNTYAFVINTTPDRVLTFTSNMSAKGFNAPRVPVSTFTPEEIAKLRKGAVEQLKLYKPIVSEGKLNDLMLKMVFADDPDAALKTYSETYLGTSDPGTISDNSKRVMKQYVEAQKLADKEMTPKTLTDASDKWYYAVQVVARELEAKGFMTDKTAEAFERSKMSPRDLAQPHRTPLRSYEFKRKQALETLEAIDGGHQRFPEIPTEGIADVAHKGGFDVVYIKGKNDPFRKVTASYSPADFYTEAFDTVSDVDVFDNGLIFPSTVAHWKAQYPELEKAQLTIQKLNLKLKELSADVSSDPAIQKVKLYGLMKEVRTELNAAMNILPEGASLEGQQGMGDLRSVLDAINNVHQKVLDATYIGDVAFADPKTLSGPSARQGPPDEIIIPDPSILLPKWKALAAHQDYTTTQKNQFEKYGYGKGMEVQLEGKTMVVASNYKGDRVKLLDPITGEAVIVSRDKVTRTTAPDTYLFDDNGDIIGPRGNLFREKVDGTRDLIDQLPREEAAIFADMRDQIHKRLLLKNAAVADQLVSKGFYVSPGKNGDVFIKRFDDPTYSKKVEGDITKIADDLTAPPAQGDVIKEIQLPHLLTPANTINKYTPEGLVKRGVMDALTTHIANIAHIFTPMLTRVANFDKTMGTNLTPAVYALKDLITQENAARQPHAIKLNAIIKAFNKLSDNDKIHWRNWVETMDVSEWKSRGVYGRRPTPQEFNYAEELVRTTELDERVRANKYLTEERQLLEMKEAGEIDDAKFAERITKLMDKYELQVTDDVAVHALRRITTENIGDLYNILRGAEIMQEGHLSRADYSKKHNLSKEMESVLHAYELAMMQAAQAGGVDPTHLISGYFAHYAKYNPRELQVTSVMRDKNVPDDIRPFASDLTRTGFSTMDELETDIGVITSRYLDGMFRNRYRDNAILNLQKEADRQIRELIEVDPVTKRRKLEGRDVDAVKNLVDEVITASRGMDAVADRAASKSADSYIAKLAGLPNREGRDFILGWMKYMELKTQGYKAIAGVRDATTFAQFYGMWFGPKRLKNAIVMLNKARKRADQLVDAGIIPTLDPTRLGSGAVPISEAEMLANAPPPPTGNVQRVARAGVNAFDKVMDKVEPKFNTVVEQGFKWSFQPYVYKLAHTLAYMETTQTVSKAISDFTAGKLDQKKFREAIDLDMYDDAVISPFEELMEKEKFSEAVDYLARHTAHLTLGEYSKMTAPSFYHNKIGRFFGQLGQWPAWALNTSGKLMSRGSKKTRLKRAAYVAGTVWAADYVADETGIDFKSWLANPMQFVFRGSPQLQFLQRLAEYQESSGYRQNALEGSLKYSAEFFLNPTPLGFQNMIEGIQRFDEGQPTEVVLFRFFGGKVDNEMFARPKLFDF